MAELFNYLNNQSKNQAYAQLIANAKKTERDLLQEIVNFEKNISDLEKKIQIVKQNPIFQLENSRKSELESSQRVNENLKSSIQEVTSKNNLIRNQITQIQRAIQIIEDQSRKIQLDKRVLELRETLTNYGIYFEQIYKLLNN